MKKIILCGLAVLSLCNSGFAQNKLWGATTYGGDQSLGTVFNIGTDGSHTYKKTDFTAIDGNYGVTGHLNVFNNKIYGVTTRDFYGTYDGQIFEWNPQTNAYVTKAYFNGVNGSHPYGGMIEFNGKFYGTTFEGGANGGGALYSFDPNTSAITKEADLPAGSECYGSLTPLNGKLYGMATGGLSPAGYVFEWDPVTGFQAIAGFDGTNGYGPYGTLAVYNGNLYGTTSYGGVAGYGNIFMIDLSGTPTIVTLKEFDGTDGYDASGELVEMNGILYGTSSYGGNGNGLLFSIDPFNGAYRVLREFDYSNGSLPIGGLVVYGNRVYGVTTSGGANGYGTVYSLNPADSLSFVNHHSFEYSEAYDAEGSLVVYMNKLYGSSIEGGLYGFGSIFEFDPATSAVTAPISFQDYKGGQLPYTNLIEANHKIFGTAYSGGSSNNGTIYEVDKISGNQTIRYSFTGGLNGYNPTGVLAVNGEDVYGYAEGGTGASGIYYTWNSVSGTFKILRNLPNGAFGNNGGLMFKDGKLAGSYEYMSATYLFTLNVQTLAMDSVSLLAGYDVYPSLTFCNNSYYGVSYNGGANGTGFIFKWDGGNALQNVYDFALAGNGGPFTALLLKGGLLYGTTYQSNELYSFNPNTNAYTVLATFNPSTGTSPYGDLMNIGDVMYGTTYYGGLNGQGSIYEFKNGIITNIHDFYSPSGYNPTLGKLLVTDAPDVSIGNVANPGYCLGSSIAVPYTVSESFAPGTVFTAFLSDASGDFTNEVPLGSITSQTSGVISGIIPNSTATGTLYRIRVKSSDGALTDANLTDLTVTSSSVVVPAVSSLNGAEFCVGTSTKLKTQDVYQTYQWYKDGSILSGENIHSLTTSTSGKYVVEVKDGNGCVSMSPEYKVNVHSPTAVTTPTGVNVVCEGSQLVVSASFASSYVWLRNDVVMANETGPALQVKQDGKYTLEATDAIGCKATSDNVIVVYKSVPAAPTISFNGTQLVSSATAGNQWYKVGLVLAGQTGQMLTPTGNGNYSVSATNGSGCTASSVTYVYNKTGIDQYAGGVVVSIYPNPVTNQLIVDKAVKGNFRVVDIAGKLVMNGELKEGKNTLEVSAITTGIYNLVLIDQKGNKSTVPFVKQ